MRPQEKSSASQNSTTRFVRDCCTRNAPKYFLLGLDVAIGLIKQSPQTACGNSSFSFLAHL